MVTPPKQNSACMAETAETPVQSPPCEKKSQFANNYGSCCRRRLCRLIPRQFLGSTNFNVFNVQPPKKPGIVFSSTFFGPTTVTPMVAAKIVGDSGMTSLQTVDYYLVLSPSTHLQSNIGPSRARRAGHRSTARARTGRLPRLRSGPSPARRAPRAPAPTTPVHC